MVLLGSIAAEKCAGCQERLEKAGFARLRKVWCVGCMSFQAYLDTIKAKTGKTPEELKVLAEGVGIYSPHMKFNSLKLWLHDEFGLGHGHCLAVWAVWKQKGWVEPPKK